MNRRHPQRADSSKRMTYTTKRGQYVGGYDKKQGKIMEGQFKDDILNFKK
jgi:hypothetical protein